MKKVEWTGVIPAITTPFKPDYSVDYDFLSKHCKWMVENGCRGIVPLGSLGEGATLEPEEKAKVLAMCVKAVGNKVPIIAGIAGLSTKETMRLAKVAADVGCSGLMVLPPYVYVGDWREMKAHVSAVIKATDLSCLLYNNPVAYKTDFLPEQVQELLNEHRNLHAIKESSTDVRRVTALKALAGDRLKILVGVDDVIVEGIAAGAVGWIAGLVNAFPKQSVDLFNLAMIGKTEKALEIYRWFLPLLRMDTVPKFVQLIKLVQEEVGMGNARVRAPRMELTGEELRQAKTVIAEALRKIPK